LKLKPGKVTHGKHHESEWLTGYKAKELPLTSHLDGTSAAVSYVVTGLAQRQGESIRENLARVITIEKLARDIEKTERMMAAEIQPRKKLALHEQLKKLRKAKEEAEA